MFRSMVGKSGVRTVILAAALLAYPCGLLAQRGAGSVGGSNAGGGAMGSGGIGTGLDVKDDLKGFHEALALQANSQQIIEYNLMVKSTESASTELRAFLEQVTKENGASEVADRNKAFEQALEKARTENTTFLQRLSDRQKTGLKETVKKLGKADSDLAQQAKALDLAVKNTKADGQQIANSAQGLERTLISFQSEQLDLGAEMSVGVRNGGEEVSFNIPPMKSSVNFASANPALGNPANPPIAITTSGVISGGASQREKNTFRLELTADLSDLQQNIAQVLSAQLDKADRCGEQIAIQNATLTSSTPASVALVQVHYERWACFGRTTNEMVEGNGTIEVKLIPGVGEDGALRLVASIGRVDAQGLVGELLRSGTLGEFVRDRITESLLATVRPVSDYKALLPPVAQGNVTLHRAQFQETGPGRLSIVLNGDIQVSSDKVTSLTSELKAGEAKGHSSPAETTPH